MGSMSRGKIMATTKIIGMRGVVSLRITSTMLAKKIMPTIPYASNSKNQQRNMVAVKSRK